MPAAIVENQFADLPNGIRLHYASAGKKGAPLMLFVHGFPEFWWEWHAQLPEFGQDYYAVAPDMRGYNLSGKPAEVAAYKPRHLVEDLVQLIQALGYGQCVLVAHDWGGAVAWNLAAAQPGLLQRLVIINAPHPWLFAQALALEPAQQQASTYMNWLRQPGSENLLAEHDFRRLEKFFTGAGQAAPWFSAAERARYREAWSRGLAGPVNYYRASPLHPPTASEPGPTKLALNAADFRVTVPTLVIWGESDIALPKTLLDGLEDQVDDLRIERIPEGSHWVVHEQPARVNRLIRDFLA